jgi:GDP-4-dehydro-6-deoxy-D-mannose reductase|tara:strand:- start:872 stop:1798 length:927 start_codon:yes stop_codon:yes gene_type:complete
VSGSGGSYLAEYILKRDPKIKLSGTYRKKNQITKKLKNIKLYKCDLTNYNQIYKQLIKEKPDLIYHFASNADVRGSFDYPMDIINNNNNVTLNLLESIRIIKNYNPVVVICSTSEVYGLVKKKDTPIKENQNYNPASPYAISKTFQDLLAQNYRLNYGLNIIITRMFTYINPRRFNLFASYWALQIAQIEKGIKKNLKHGNLDSIRTLLSIEDMCEGYYFAAVKGKIGEIYNIGGTKPIKVGDVLKILIQKSHLNNIKCSIDKKLLRKTDVTLQIPSIAKFTKQTKWKPKQNINDNLTSLLKECRKIV